MSPTKQSALMKHSFGQVTSPRASIKQWMGLIYVVNTASFSTRTSSSLELTLLTLQDLKLPLKMFDPERSTLMPSMISQPQQSWFGLLNQVLYAFAATKCMLPFRSFLSRAHPSTGTMSSLRNPKLPSSEILKRVSASLINPNQLAWLPTGPKMA